MRELIQLVAASAGLVAAFLVGLAFSVLQTVLATVIVVYTLQYMGII